MNNPADKRMGLINMGCRVNWAEMDHLRQQGLAQGYLPAVAGEGADLVVINTCSVTGESERQARQLIRRVIRRNPQARVVVTGCYAQRDPAAIAAIAGVNLVVGNDQKNAILALVDQRPSPSLPIPPVVGGVERARVFLQVQNGCSERCTFCVIPPLRGPSRSLPMAQVWEEAEKHVQNGLQEVVLSGINLGAYGRDLHPAASLATLVEKMLGLTGLSRLRLSSLDPADLEPPLLELLGHESILCDHLHLSVQSGDDLVLKRMGRHCDSQTVLQRVTRLRQQRPSMIFGADFIVGFPTESDQAFQHTVDLVAAAGFSLLHVFPYSDRPGTPAAAIPQRFHTSPETVRQRAALLRQAGKNNLIILLEKMINKPVDVLIESVTNGVGMGKSSGFLPVSCKGVGDHEIGKVLPCHVVGWHEETLVAYGHVLPPPHPPFRRVIGGALVETTG